MIRDTFVRIKRVGRPPSGPGGLVYQFVQLHDILNGDTWRSAFDWDSDLHGEAIMAIGYIRTVVTSLYGDRYTFEEIYCQFREGLNTNYFSYPSDWHDYYDEETYDYLHRIVSRINERLNAFSVALETGNLTDYFNTRSAEE